MNFTQIKETCLYCRDLEKARSFYQDTLGLQLISYVSGKHAFFRAGSSVLLLFNPEDSKLKKSPPGHFAEGKFHFAFEVKAGEYEDHKRALAEKGVTIIAQLTWDSGQESCYFEDPEGNILEIVPEGIWR